MFGFEMGAALCQLHFFPPPPARTAPPPPCRAPANVNSVIYCLSVAACEGWPTFPSLPAQPVWEGKEKECCCCSCLVSETFTSPCFNSMRVFRARNGMLTACSHISHYFQEVRVSVAEKVTQPNHLSQSDVQNLNPSTFQWLYYGNFKLNCKQHIVCIYVCACACTLVQLNILLVKSVS